MTFNIFATSTSDILLSDLDNNFSLIGTADAVSTLYPGANTSITYGNGTTANYFLGSVTVNGYTLPSTDGTSGQVLTTNGSGTINWTTIDLSTLGGVPTTRTISSGTGLSGGGDLSADRTLSLANTAVSPGSYTLASITVDQQGRITAASSGTAGSVNSVTATSPISSSGGTNPDISLDASYGDTQNPYASKTANYVLAAPNGSAGLPTFRAIVAADIPTLNQNTTGTAANVTGIVAIANGGTNASDAATALTNLGAYPASNPSGYTSNTGTVTSVDVSGGTTGLTTSGGPVTSSGTITLAGTLAIANGGTGATSAANALTNLGAYPDSNPNGYTDYSDADVDTHLNTATATTNQVLSWTGSDYDWVDQSGGSSALTIQNKTAAYTVVAGDLGTIINCTSGTFTVSLTAAATLGSGFNCWIWNTSSTVTDAITIDPNGTETIDGRTTLVLQRGEGMQIVCDGTNWQTGDKKVMRGYAENLPTNYVRPIATGSGGVAIGGYNQATASDTTAVGYNARATASGALALGFSPLANQTYASSIGTNSAGSGSSSQGIGSMALGGSYASGADSFAAAVANNTSSYGATGTNAVAIGDLSKATNTNAVCISNTSTASAQNAVVIGGSSGTASANGSVVLGGSSNTASGVYSTAKGYYGDTNGIRLKHATGVYPNMQGAYYVLAYATTNATPIALNTDAWTPSSTNQIILPNNSAYAFSGTIVARQQASQGTASAAWKVEGLIRREGSAGTTVLVNSSTTTIDNTPGWTLALSADTTNGGLAITATGAAATNIRWVATIQTSEVTYA